MSGRSTATVQVLALRGTRAHDWPETVVGEEPLEIRLGPPGGTATRVAVTMRTPGNDFELAVGFLRAEGMLDPAALRAVRYCPTDGDQRYNVVTVEASGPLDLSRARALTVSSACGVCGSASIDDLALRCAVLPPGPVVAAKVLLDLPAKLRAAQAVFEVTGGVHAAGLFDATGERLVVREDVGRHNAVDKLLGWQVLEGAGHPVSGEPGAPTVLAVSGRASFELVQKAAVGRLPILVAVSAPSSLAVETARRLGVTLVAFARGDRANVYSAPARVVPAS